MYIFQMSINKKGKIHKKQVSFSSDFNNTHHLVLVYHKKTFQEDKSKSEVVA